MKNKKFNFREEYVMSWNYIKECKNFIWGIVALFFIFSLIGFFIPTPDIISEQILKFIEELLAETEGMSQLELISFIFSSNLQSSFIGMIFGFFLGVLPIILAIFNGYLLGFVAFFSVKSESILILWRILPHGIFELPAVFISLGMGLKFGTFLFQKNKAESFRKFLWNSLRVFIFIIIPLLLIAAIIEGSFIFFLS